jgi:prepilin-type N-terminal cleavage/methylation domain-containing protein
MHSWRKLKTGGSLGFTLIEVMVGTFIFSIAVLCGVVTFMYGQVSINNSTNYRAAVELARSKIEELEAYPYANIASATETNVPMSGVQATRTTTVTNATLNTSTYKQITVAVAWTQGNLTRNVSVYTIIGQP